ncbi:hemolysin family protein [Motilibacter deserti]|uniref:HlyC/CorC family transporter n=1 Tax=Motilibacter deserti TaxID=2714956 RepID=A0ABX0GT58_9ACTN|nr:hemolysin family protein [Motilibacter deserti]NHC12854.1 HlyC/CorC family transporter [Motilibacter deserti]
MTVALVSLALALVLVVACGAYVAAEFSLLTVDRPSVERAAEAGDRGAQGVLAGLRSLSTQLSGAQVGITVTNLLIGYLSEPAIAELVRPLIEAAGSSERAARTVSVSLALVLATVLTMVFGELVPKNLAIARPLATAKSVQGFSRLSTRVTGPAIRLLNGTANALLHRFGVEAQEELASARSPQELVSLVRRSAEQGTLEAETAVLLQQSFAFGERRARDVMTPRVQMHTLPADATLAEVVAAVKETGRSRFPIVQGVADDVIGIVHVKHALAVPHERRARVQVESVMVDPVLVPDTLELDPLLDILKQGLQAAIAIDEFGGVAGIVTLEDLIEELVGDVIDEHDERRASVRQLPDGTWSLSGQLRPDEASRHVGVDLPQDEDYETIAGLISAELGRVPAVGDAVEIEAPVSGGLGHEQVTLRVVAMDGLRVDRVELVLAGAPPEPPAGDGPDARPGGAADGGGAR